MLTPRIGLVAVAAACVIAAGTGAYVATRQLNTPATATSAIADDRAPAEPVTVHETEAVVEDAPGVSQPPAPGVSQPPAPGASQPSARATPLATAPATERPAAASTPSPSPRAAAPVRPRQSARAAPAPRKVPQTQPPPERAAEAARKQDPAEAFPPLEGSEPVTVPDLPRAETVEPRTPQREFRALVVARDSVLGLQLESTASTDSAQVEDRVSARVSRDVTVNGRVAIPAGSRVLGAVTLVERGGKMKERARLGVRFHTLVLADGTNVPIQTDTVYREGESPGNASAAKIGGGAIGGAIIGGILGGARGAVIGGSAGAGAGTAAVMAGSRRHATIAAGSSMTLRVLSPVTITVEE